MRASNQYLNNNFGKLVGLICLIITFLAPYSLLAQDLSINANVSNIIEDFTNRSCIEITKGLDTSDAIESSAKKMISSLIFSGALKQVMLIPKEELTSTITNSMFNQCGDEIRISQEELKDYLTKLAENDQNNSKTKPFKPFGIG